jgi:hypothetical protein
MVEIKIQILELKTEGDDTVKELEDFVREKTKADVSSTADEILVTTKDEKVSRNYVRVVVRKFLHKVGLKEYYKVISGKDNAFVVKEKKVAEEEE